METTWLSLGGKERPFNDKHNMGRAYVSESASPSQLSEDPSPTTLGAIAQSGILQSFSLINVDGKNPWIMDSDATYHLTGSQNILCPIFRVLVMRRYG